MVIFCSRSTFSKTLTNSDGTVCPISLLDNPVCSDAQFLISTCVTPEIAHCGISWHLYLDHICNTKWRSLITLLNGSDPLTSLFFVPSSMAHKSAKILMNPKKFTWSSTSGKRTLISGLRSSSGIYRTSFQLRVLVSSLSRSGDGTTVESENVTANVFLDPHKCFTQ